MILQKGKGKKKGSQLCSILDPVREKLLTEGKRPVCSESPGTEGALHRGKWWRVYLLRTGAPKGTVSQPWGKSWKEMSSRAGQRERKEDGG